MTESFTVLGGDSSPMRRRLDVEAELAGVQDPFVRECLRILCEHYNKIRFDLRPEPLFRRRSKA